MYAGCNRCNQNTEFRNLRTCQELHNGRKRLVIIGQCSRCNLTSIVKVLEKEEVFEFARKYCDPINLKTTYYIPTNDVGKPIKIVFENYKDTGVNAGGYYKPRRKEWLL